MIKYPTIPVIGAITNPRVISWHFSIARAGDITGFGMSPHNEADRRLQRMKELWGRLQQTPVGSAEYRNLTKQIRAESDAYNALLNAHFKPENPNDDEP